MTAVAVAVFAAGAWLIVRGIRDLRHARHLTPRWEQDHRDRQLARFVDDSGPITTVYWNGDD